MNKTNKRGGFYWDNDIPYISVTTVLGDVLKKTGLEYWMKQQVYLAMVKNPYLSEAQAMQSVYETSSSAADRGSTVHSLIEAYKSSGAVIDTVPEQFKGYANAFYKWLAYFKPEILEQEKTLKNEEHKYAGTCDMVCMKEGKKFLIDFKTSEKGQLYPEVELQLSAYKHCLPDVDEIMAVGLSQEGEYIEKVCNDRFDIFLNVKNIWVWNNEKKLKKIGYIR